MENFYDKLDLKYPERAVLSEKYHISDTGPKSFYIPVLMPYVQNSTNVTSVPNRSYELQNDNKNIGLSNYTTGSTIKIKIPEYIANTVPRDIYGYVHPGIEFIVVFLGGDINKPKIIGGDW